jgi:hypothetical protein
MPEEPGRSVVGLIKRSYQCLNDFTSGIKSDEEPTAFPPVGNEADRMVPR